MRLPRKPASLLGFRRPVLRMQLTLLYSGLFIGLLAAVLLATGTLISRSEVRAPGGAAGSAQAAGTIHHFDPGPALIALIAAVVALAVAWWLAGRFLRPLRAITTTAQEISATNLHRRLDLSGPDDELTELGRTLDELFRRLEASFESQRHFVANASHELRTPLAGQRTLLQVALADPDADTQSLRSSCEQALALGDQQERLIDALLTLATSERGVEQWESFDLAEVARSVVDVRHGEAERRDIRIDAEFSEAPTSGDPDLVESLVANLVDNALRHNVSGGRVDISTATRAGRASISVSNTGAVITPQAVDRLFQPFQRLGRDRTRRTEGHGLGLAIVRAIADAHGAALTGRARPGGGLEIEVVLPGPTQPRRA